MPGGLPKKTARALLDIEDKDHRPDHPQPQSHHGRDLSVLFPVVARSAVVQPGRSGGRRPCLARWRTDRCQFGYLCCGFRSGSGDFGQGRQDDHGQPGAVHTGYNTLNYLDIKTVVVSCGTADQLQGLPVDKIFPGSRIIDIHEYLLERITPGQRQLDFAPRAVPQTR
jgi:hypothetical protein